MRTCIVNIRDLDPNWEKDNQYVSITGYFANPHSIGWCVYCGKKHNREEAIEAYRITFLNKLRLDVEFVKQVTTLKGKRLVCYCVPKLCHGNIIAEYLNSGENL